ncbi:helix-turn-helix domain-containing protein [Gluconacetobacter entanii]|uniref:Helix-turn-helix domain-containing protein n=1 Tax=Gluconacetobacter entanii TaxID=108528 RepID=A0A318PSU2_9PROT|nr:helix-turn-helix transcriptional regulator [Gluconacetobacter entanii]MBE7620554.1 helix-turn-helix domain-containing protein [Komagataeibacter sp. FXV2]MCE2579164.1 helix-turn-helix domain-containing protein [Komagataeibacter sp. FNDCR1]MBY4639814.1 helix-turn-helix domain-containing protein [Gluconacetobacter entanii]MCW4580513.1 helix-turn-helix domain-containing protein [Gluconacetobacter entanii]MCW4583866.1 helix-turn-helix domain-containing protein [Gluconacetobacter entanii]
MNNKLSSTPSPVDVYVGSRIRLRRTLLGMSQERLGTALGLTFQQVQKYERGANRVGASRLYDLARVLDVPIAFFFDGMPDEAALPQASSMPVESFAEARGAFGGTPAPAQPEGGDDRFASNELALLSRRETIDLVRSYYRISDPAVRRRVLDLVRSMATTA